MPRSDRSFMLVNFHQRWAASWNHSHPPQFHLVWLHSSPRGDYECLFCCPCWALMTQHNSLARTVETHHSKRFHWALCQYQVSICNTLCSEFHERYFQYSKNLKLLDVFQQYLQLFCQIIHPSWISSGTTEWCSSSVLIITFWYPFLISFIMVIKSKSWSLISS